MKRGGLFGRLWRDYVSRYLSDIVLLAPVLAVVAACGVSYALILKFATDGIIARDVFAVIWAPVAVIAVVCVRAVALWGQAVLSQSIALKVLRDLQQSMFSKLMDVDFARYAREEPGRLVSRFTNDINIVSEALVRGGQSIIRDTLTLIGAIASRFHVVAGLGADVGRSGRLRAGGPAAAADRRARHASDARGARANRHALGAADRDVQLRARGQDVRAGEAREGARRRSLRGAA
jgi:subfamily B ATP-binding cassette protein MsbA